MHCLLTRVTVLRLSALLLLVVQMTYGTYQMVTLRFKVTLLRLGKSQSRQLSSVLVGWQHLMMLLPKTLRVKKSLMLFLNKLRIQRLGLCLLSQSFLVKVTSQPNQSLAKMLTPLHAIVLHNLRLLLYSVTFLRLAE